MLAALVALSAATLRNEIGVLEGRAAAAAQQESRSAQAAADTTAQAASTTAQATTTLAATTVQATPTLAPSRYAAIAKELDVLEKRLAAINVGRADAPGPAPYSDTTSPAVRALAALKVVEGCTRDTFCPQAPVTRVQLTQWLYRALSSAEPAREARPFSMPDVPAAAAVAVEWALRKRIVDPCSKRADSFCPDAPVTRGQAATIVRAAVGRYFPMAKLGQGFTFPDVPATHDAHGDIVWLTRAALVTKAPAYNPDKPMTREDMAALLDVALIATAASRT